VIFTWGKEYFSSSTNCPIMLPFTSHKIAEIVAGSYHYFAFTEKRMVFTWGLNINGQLGLGNNTNYSSPVKIPFFEDKTIRKLACGDFHTVAVTSNSIFIYFSSSDLYIL